MSHIVRSLREVAEHFGRCPRTAQRWRRAGLPRCSAGYDLGQVEQWLKARAYIGASLRKLEEQALADDLFELAVQELRRGLQHLCQAFIKARGESRQHLVDRAVRQILKGCVVQASLLEQESREPACSHEPSENDMRARAKTAIKPPFNEC